MSGPLSVLIIDDEESMRDSISQVLAGEGYAPHGAATARAGLASFNRESFELVFLDLRLPDGEGLKVLRQIKEASPETPVIVITAYGSIEVAVEAIKLGAFEFLTKPFTPEELRVAAKKALKSRSLVLENILLHRELKSHRRFDKIVGSSPSMRQVLHLITQAGSTDSPVLLTGESGTGKELAARQIHRLSARHHGPFVPVDCGGLGAPLLEDELFGHIKGAFPGAQEAKIGRFELANGGTVFFNGVEQVGLPLQPKILRAIQDREVTRIGHARSIKVNVRAIASTNVNLATAVHQGSFRTDLFYRLSVVPIHLPPLRERKDDIPALVTHFLEEFGRRAGGSGPEVSRRALLALQDYDWPGNIRELENTIERAVALCGGREIDLPHILSRDLGPGVPARGWGGGASATLADVEKEHIETVLREQGGNKGRTAAILGIDRKTLWTKIKKYNLEGRTRS
jgi:DNA-binding NtrC family response regulator